SRGSSRLPRSERRRQEHHGEGSHRADRTDLWRNPLQGKGRPCELACISKCRRLCPGGAESLFANDGSRVSSTSRAFAWLAASHARQPHGPDVALFFALGGSARSARVLFEGDAAENSSLRCPAPRS